MQIRTIKIGFFLMIFGSAVFTYAQDSTIRKSSWMFEGGLNILYPVDQHQVLSNSGSAGQTYTWYYETTMKGSMGLYVQLSRLSDLSNHLFLDYGLAFYTQEVTIHFDGVTYVHPGGGKRVYFNGEGEHYLTRLNLNPRGGIGFREALAPTLQLWSSVGLAINFFSLRSQTAYKGVERHYSTGQLEPVDKTFDYKENLVIRPLLKLDIGFLYQLSPRLAAGITVERPFYKFFYKYFIYEPTQLVIRENNFRNVRISLTAIYK